MPLHAQILCIGGNGLFAFFFLLAAQQTAAKGDFGLGFFLAALAAAAGYTCWVLMKFRKYLSAEESLEREVHIEKLREELERMKGDEPPTTH